MVAKSSSNLEILRYPSVKTYSRAHELEDSTELPWLSFDAYELLDTCRERVPNLPKHSVGLFFSPSRTLAKIDTRPEQCHILINSVLNRPDVPKEVIEFIFIHELIHLVVPGRELDGKWVSHPPEFWEFEKMIPGNKMLVLSWIWLVLCDLVIRDIERECMYIKPNWKKKIMKHYPCLNDMRYCFNLDEKLQNDMMELI